MIINAQINLHSENTIKAFREIAENIFDIPDINKEYYSNKIIFVIHLERSIGVVFKSDFIPHIISISAYGIGISEYLKLEEDKMKEYKYLIPWSNINLIEYITNKKESCKD